MLKINLISDLHSEIEEYTHPKVNADILVVAGDYGNQFMHCCGKNDNRYKESIILEGNHDYWGKDIDSIDFKKHRKIYKVDDYVFIACPLWSNFWNVPIKKIEKDFYYTKTKTILCGLDKIEMKTKEPEINDFKKIKNFTLEKCKSLFEKDFKFISDNVEKYKDKKVIICTHFAPSQRATTPKYAIDKTNKYFVNNLDDFIIENPQIKNWFFGHVHSSYDFMVGGCRCVCNPRGKPTNNMNPFDIGYENPDFDPYKIIEI